MGATRLTVGLLVVVALGAVGFAVSRAGARRAVDAEVVAARQEREALRARIVVVESEIKRAEQRAAEAEKDSGEMLRAVAAVREANAPKRAPESALSASARPTPTRGTVTPPGPELSDAERERLAHERAYQQGLAKKRQAEAMARATVDEEVRALDPVMQFGRRIAAAERFVALAEFEIAQRIYNQAMALKPPDLVPGPEVAGLRATIAAQREPVEVSFASDGETFVFVNGDRVLGKFTTVAAKIMPGDYLVVGRRKGFRDATMTLSLRNGVPAPPVTMICTQRDAGAAPPR